MFCSPVSRTPCRALLLLAAAAASAAAEYGQSHGLPNLAVSAIGFDRHGFLLAGTDRGLYRLEGNRFRPFGPELARQSIRAVVAGSDGSVWAATRTHLWFRVGNEPFRAAGTGEHMIRPGPSSLAADSKGNVYVTSSGGVATCNRSGRCGWIPIDGKPEGLAIGTGGELWVAGTRIWRVEPGKPAVTVSGPATSGNWRSAAADRSGRVWFRADHEFAAWEPANGRLRRLPSPGSTLPQYHGMAAGPRGLIAVSGESLWILDPESGERWKPLPAVPESNVGTISALTIDSHGDPWAGIDGAGIRSFPGQGEWSTWNRSTGLGHDNVRVIHRDRKGGIWIAAESLLYEWAASGDASNGGVWVRRLAQAWEPGDPVNAIEDDPEGRLWIGLESGRVVRWDPKSGKRESAPAGGVVTGLAWDGPGIVATTERGPYSSPRDKLDFRPEPVTGPANRLYSITRAPDGLFAAGMGLLVREDGRWRQAIPALTGQRLRRAAIARDGTVWAAFHQAAGAVSVSPDGAVTVHDSSNALNSDRASFLEIDEEGRVWTGTDSGIHVFDGKWWHSWDQADGLAWNHTNSRAFASGGDGTVWIGTARGVSRFRVPGLTPEPLPVVITRVEPGTPSPRDPETIRIPPAARSLEIDFAVPRYVSPGRMRYEYWIQGIDKSWTATEAPSIRLGMLPPASYSVDVRARAGFGPWSQLPHPLRFEVERQWWQTGWATALWILTAVAMLAGAIRLRTRAGIQRERELAQLVEQRTRDLAMARDEAVSANQAKATFLAKVSHEIRTPLNGVIGTLGLLRNSLGPRQRDLADIAMSSAENLMVVINDILDISKIESGRMTIESVVFPLRDTVRSAVSLMEAKAAAKGVPLELEFGEGLAPWVKSDPVRIQQVLLNLVSNAIKFTSRGEVRVRVHPAPAPAPAGTVRFEVSDTGIGIPASAHADLFRPFTQVDDSTTRIYGGTGLGLAISRQLCELMGGRIDFVSAEGRGSTFWFELPLAPGQEPPHPEPQPAGEPIATPAGLAPRILLAEDNIANQRVAAGMLEHLGFSCEFALNGQEALERLAREKFDIILLDCQMPVMDGYEAARRIRAGETCNSAIRIVALTANAMPGDREECIRAGMDDYLSKPFTLAALEKAIRLALRSV